MKFWECVISHNIWILYKENCSGTRDRLKGLAWMTTTEAKKYELKRRTEKTGIQGCLSKTYMMMMMMMFTKSRA